MVIEETNILQEPNWSFPLPISQDIYPKLLRPILTYLYFLSHGVLWGDRKPVLLSALAIWKSHKVEKHFLYYEIARIY